MATITLDGAPYIVADGGRAYYLLLDGNVWLPDGRKIAHLWYPRLDGPATVVVGDMRRKVPGWEPGTKYAKWARIVASAATVLAVAQGWVPSD